MYYTRVVSNQFNEYERFCLKQFDCTNIRDFKIRYGEVLLRRYEAKITPATSPPDLQYSSLPAVALLSGTAKCLDGRTSHLVSIN